MRIVPAELAHVKVGDEKNRWTAIGCVFYARILGDLRRFVVCECRCGTIGVVSEDSFRKGTSGSCGCLLKEAAAATCRRVRTTHGGAGTRLHQIWKGMRRRCLRPSNPGWPHYGGRGIEICPEWSTFAPFRDWAMTSGYADNLTIERQRNNEGYSPGNCRWVPQSEQTRNTRKTVTMTAFGETKILSDWMRDPRNRLSRVGLWRRIRSGMSLEDALTIPDRNKARTKTKRARK